MKKFFLCLVLVNFGLMAFDCPNDGYHADPEDCTKYYYCTDGVATRIDCPSGLWWDDRFKLCNYPENITCTVDDTDKITLVGECEDANGIVIGYYVECGKSTTIQGEPCIQKTPCFP